MKKVLFYLFISLSLVSFLAATIEGERFQQSAEAVQLTRYGHIDAKGLKALIDSQTSLTLLDARGLEWHDGTIIPGAKLAFYENTAEELRLIVPNKESLIIVYCFSFTCPLSDRLAQKLIDLGYNHVLEYPAGLKEWRDIAEYPIEIIQ